MAAKWGVIRNPRSGLVLDASDYEITVQRFTGSSLQLWTMEPLGQGKSFILNKGNGNVLDVRGAPSNGSNLTTAPKHGDIKKQKWIVNSNYSIVNAIDNNLALDIEGENYSPGTNVILYSKHGRDNQQFYFQCQ